jgi:5-methylcytosine-specific restriction endonuclease McrA
MSGKNNPGWRGGINSIMNGRLNLSSWKIIRNKILKRDKFSCQVCHRKNCKLNIHHIIPFRITKNNSFNNLITLCDSCHQIKEHQGQQYFNFHIKNFYDD